MVAMVGPERKLYAVQLPGHQNAGVKIGHHSDALQVVGQGSEFSGDVETGYGAHFRIAERSRDPPQIVGTHAHVAIADDDYFVRGVVHQAGKFGDFVVGGDASGTVQDANAALREVASELG